MSGFLIRCRDAGEAEKVVEWYARMRSARPGLPLGLVCAADACVEALGKCAFPIHPVMSPAALVAGGVPTSALDQVRSAAVEGRILEELVMEHGPGIREAGPTLSALVAQAVRGGMVTSVARDLEVTRETVRRRLNAVGIRAGLLMRRVRLRAFQVRIELGHDRDLALNACGWMSHEARRKAAARIPSGVPPAV